MELQQLRYVVAIAEEGSFTRAAERCFVVQSSLSHQIKALEIEIGVRLFARTSRRVALTAAGEAFLPAARASLEAAERAAVDAASAAGEVRGSLAIGMIPTVTAVDMPRALAAFRRAHPAVRIGVGAGSSDDFMTAIAAGRMDVAVLGLPAGVTPRGVASRELKRERLVAVLAAEHPLASRRRLRLADLADEVFVDFPAGAPGRAQSDLAFAAAGVHREVAFEVAAMELMLDLVRQGLGVALLPPDIPPFASRGLAVAPGSVAPALAASATLCTVELSDGPVRVEHLAWSAFNPSAALRAFLDVLEVG